MSFQTVFATTAGGAPTLPFVHTTQSTAFWTIFRGQEFVALKACSVLGGFYSFFFYGRAAYRPSSTKNKPGSTYELCVFVLKPEAFEANLVGRTVRLHPFDTGAFSVYDTALGLNLNLQDFELPQTLSSLGDVRALFWPTDELYCACDIATLLPAPASHYDDAIVSYHSLLRRLIGGEIDDRCATMEIAVETPQTAPMPLSLDAIEGIVVPMRFLDSPAIQDFMSNYPGAKIRHYPTRPYLKPSERHSEVAHLVTEIMAS